MDRIAVHLDLERRAGLDGGNDEPPSGIEVITGTQAEIVAYFRELQRTAEHEAAKAAERVRAHRETIELSETAARLRDLAPRCEDKVLRLNAQFQSRLAFLEERAAQERQHYAVFREANDLRRVAQYPRLPALYHALAAATFAAGAAVLHDPSAWGLASEVLLPISWAVLIASVAVLLPFAIATTVFRRVNHVLPTKRSAGWAAAAAVMAVIGALALLAGYPPAAADTVGDPMVVIRSMLSAPMDIDLGAIAWSTSGLVILMGIAGFLAGYASDDAYPGYGAVQRAYYRARDDYEAHVKRLRKRLDAVIDAASAEANMLPRKLKAKIKKCSRLLEEAKRLPGSSSNYRVVLEDACNTLLHRYRTVNASARRTALPESFSEHVCFRSEPAPILAESIDDQAGLAELNRSVAEIEREAIQVRERLRVLNRTAIAAMTSNAASTTG